MKTSISYTIPLHKDYNYQKHLLGINKLILGEATDDDITGSRQIYSAGRDGLIMQHSMESTDGKKCSFTHRRTFTCGHSNWINDLCFIGSDYLVSASSDCMINVWKAGYLTNESGSMEPSAEVVLSIGNKRTCKEVNSCFNCPNSSCNYYGHHDYITCLSTVDQQNGQFVSGGLDGVFLWDIGANDIIRMQNLEAESPLYTDNVDHVIVPLSAIKDGSVMAIDAADGIVSVAYGHNRIRLYDPRKNGHICELKGHTDTIRSVKIIRGKESLISGSSDSTVKFWSLKMNRYFSSIETPSPVRCLTLSDRFHDNFSVGCSNGSIWSYELGDFTSKDGSHQNCFYDKTCGYTGYLIAKEDSPVNSLVCTSLDEGRNSVLITSFSNTSDIKAFKNVKNYSLDGLQDAMEMLNHFASDDYDGDDFDVATLSESVVPLNANEIGKSIGEAGLVKCQTMDDRRHVLSQDFQGNLYLYDIVKCERIRKFKSKNFDKIFDQLNELTTYTGTWCSVDTNLGCLTVTMDESRYSDAEAYADEMKISDDYPGDQRVVLGRWILTSLFSSWRKNIVSNYSNSPTVENTRSSLQKSPSSPIDNNVTRSTATHTIPSGNSTTSSQNSLKKATSSIDYVPPLLDFSYFTIVAISEDAGEKVCSMSRLRTFLGNVNKGHISSQLGIDLPAWATRCILEGHIPAKDVVKVPFRLAAYPNCGLNDLPAGQDRLAANRMIRIKKLLHHAVDKANPIIDPKKSVKIAARPDEWLECICEDIVIDKFATLGSIKQRIANSRELVLYYRPKSNAPYK